MNKFAVGDKILAQLIDPEKETASGIQLSAKTEQKYKQATVIDIAPTLNTVLKVGDIIKFDAVVFEYPDGLIVLRESQVAFGMRPD